MWHFDRAMQELVPGMDERVRHGVSSMD
jgi:hypothetical protein